MLYNFRNFETSLWYAKPFSANKVTTAVSFLPPFSSSRMELKVSRSSCEFPLFGVTGHIFRFIYFCVYIFFFRLSPIPGGVGSFKLSSRPCSVIGLIWIKSGGLQITTYHIWISPCWSACSDQSYLKCELLDHSIGRWFISIADVLILYPTKGGRSALF